MRPSPEHIERLLPGQRFVFGSNEAGRHGRGAAWTACRRFGAERGVGVGPTGRCYAIPTKNRWMSTLSLREIKGHVERFIAYAGDNPDLEFLVTEIGCGLAGYKPKDIAPMFKGSPNNVRLPQSFIDILKQ